MLVQEITALLNPLRYAATKSVSNAMHKALEITDKSVSLRIPHVAMDIAITLDIEGYTAPIHVDRAAFLTIVNSLTASRELVFKHGDGALFWSCGRSKGKIACLSLPAMEPIHYLVPDDDTTRPFEWFLDSLAFGSLSCDVGTMASVGMAGVGVSMDPCYIVSSDNTTVSVAFGKASEMPIDAPDFITLSADTITLLKNTLKETGYWEINDSTIKYTDGVQDILVSQVAPLEKLNSLRDLIKTYSGGSQSFDLPLSTILLFMKRASAMTADKPRMVLIMTIEQDRVTIEFDEQATQTQEFFDVTGLSIAKPLTIRVNAAKFTRALAYCNEIVIDYLPERVLVMRSKGSDYLYIMGGIVAR